MISRIIALTFLMFLAGSTTTYFKLFPSTYFINAYKAGVALYVTLAAPAMPHRTNLWRDPRTEITGAQIFDADKITPGHTLFTSTHKQSTFLIDTEGNIVHEWHLKYRSFVDDESEEQDPLPENFIYMRRAHVFPNGDLLAMYVGYGKTPWGLALVKMDKHSNLIWKYMKQVHHDFDIDEEGNIYTLGHHITNELPSNAKHLDPLHIEDTIIKLSPDGKELNKFSMMNAIANSPYKRATGLIQNHSNGDYIHTNAINYINEEQAKNFPFGKPGQLLISMRELDALAVVDMKTEKISWLMTGNWRRQHDPDLLPNGNILLFDNQGKLDYLGSRVIEIDPSTNGIVWSFEGTKETPFYSLMRGSQQRLDNGNTLITESAASRILEITLEGEIVWEYSSTIRRKDILKKMRAPALCWAERIPLDYFQFEFNGGLSVE